MSFTIICIGLPEKPVQGTYTSAGFDAAVHAELGSAVLPYNGRRYNPDGKQIWLGEGMPAQDTANKILLPCSPVVDPLLNEIPLRSFTDTDKQSPAEIWKRKAAAQRKHADPRQIESRQAVIERVEKVIEKIGNTEAIVITYPLFSAGILEIYEYNELLQDYYKKRNDDIVILGMSGSKEGARQVLCDLLEDHISEEGVFMWP